MPITPKGTRIWPICMPLGRYLKLDISPIGSGRAAICCRPSAILWMDFSVIASLSNMAASKPLAFAASISCLLAANSADFSRRTAAAIKFSAWFLALVSAAAMAREAARAATPSFCIVSLISMDDIILTYYLARTLAKPKQSLESSNQASPCITPLAVRSISHSFCSAASS